MKRDRLEAARVGAYWLVDPDGPTVTVLELRDGTLLETQRAAGTDLLEVTFPFPLSLRPVDLLGG